MTGSAWHLRLCGVALVLGLAASCQDDGGSIGDTEGYSAGVLVLDAESGAPVSATSLRLVSDTLYETEGRTNQDGRATLTLASDTPKARLRVSKSGYATQTQSIYFDAQHVDLSVELRPE